MSTELTLADGLVGIIDYTLKNAEGEVLDTSEGRGPMPYLHGASNIIPGLEAALVGKKQGDHVEVTIAPADAYGEHNGQEPVQVKRNELPANVDWQPGMPLQAEVEEGQMVMLWITKTEGAWVWLTQNHPLAGVELHFIVDVVRVREALDVEVTHGHPHGVDGTEGHDH